MSDLTPWFPGNVKPVREGVYQRQIPLYGDAYWVWNGARWLNGGYATPTSAKYHSGTSPSSEQCMKWRGLAADPEKAK